MKGPSSVVAVSFLVSTSVDAFLAPTASRVPTAGPRAISTKASPMRMGADADPNVPLDLDTGVISIRRPPGNVKLDQAVMDRYSNDIRFDENILV